MADLDELGRLLAAASPGPWCVVGLPARTYLAGVANGDFRNVADMYRDDAALVVALVNAAPALIAAARERDRLRALCREVAGYMSARPMHPLSAEADLYERLRAAGGGT